MELKLAEILKSFYFVQKLVFVPLSKSQILCKEKLSSPAIHILTQIYPSFLRDNFHYTLINDLRDNLRLRSSVFFPRDIFFCARDNFLKNAREIEKMAVTILDPKKWP